MSSSLQVAGLASGFDWKTFVDQIMDVERAPANRLGSEKSANNQKVGLLDTLGSRLGALQDAASALRSGVFGQRTVTSATANSSWRTSASADTPTGQYVVAVTQLATAAVSTGRSGIAAPLSATAGGVADLTIATLPIAQPVTAGKFSVNGHQVDVALTDSLQDVFDAIATATSGDVTAAYNPATDKITLTSGSGTLMLGAANDTSNFLTALKLGNSGTAAATSAAKLGAVKTGAALASANLAGSLGADADGNGSFSINGVSIGYNVNRDSLSAVLSRINESGAGVNARYDGLNDRLVLRNNVTGDLGLAAADSSGQLLAALGLTTGATFTRGSDAEFTLNGGETRRSASNTLTADVHGIAGLSVTIDAEETQTLTVAADGSAMRGKIETFISKFNDVQQFIDAQTQISTDAKGNVSAAPLSGNREIQEWGRSLRQLAFGAVTGLGGAIDRLNDLGIDFKRGTNELEINDGSRLDSALADSTDDVAAFFDTATTGFSARLGDFVDRVSGQNEDQKKHLNASSDSLTEQIAAIDRRLAQQREMMEAAFMQMERAQSLIKQQQTAIENMFATKS